MEKKYEEIFYIFYMTSIIIKLFSFYTWIASRLMRHISMKRASGLIKQLKIEISFSKNRKKMENFPNYIL